MGLVLKMHLTKRLQFSCPDEGYMPMSAGLVPSADSGSAQPAVGLDGPQPTPDTRHRTCRIHSLTHASRVRCRTITPAVNRAPLA